MTDQIDALLRDIFNRTRCVAVVGFSLNPARPSHYVAQYLQDLGKRIVPINPGHAGKSALGEVILPDLAAIPPEAGVDMIDLFRRSEHVPPIVDQALTHLPDLRTIWMQLGVEHQGAAQSARTAGVDVVMNRCPKIEYPRLFGAIS